MLCDKGFDRDECRHSPRAYQALYSRAHALNSRAACSDLDEKMAAKITAESGAKYFYTFFVPLTNVGSSDGALGVIHHKTLSAKRHTVTLKGETEGSSSMGEKVATIYDQDHQWHVCIGMSLNPPCYFSISLWC